MTWSYARPLIAIYILAESLISNSPIICHLHVPPPPFYLTLVSMSGCVSVSWPTLSPVVFSIATHQWKHCDFVDNMVHLNNEKQRNTRRRHIRCMKSACAVDSSVVWLAHVSHTTKAWMANEHRWHRLAAMTVHLCVSIPFNNFATSGWGVAIRIFIRW